MVCFGKVSFCVFAVDGGLFVYVIVHEKFVIEDIHRVDEGLNELAAEIGVVGVSVGHFGDHAAVVVFGVLPAVGDAESAEITFCIILLRLKEHRFFVQTLHKARINGAGYHQLHAVVDFLVKASDRVFEGLNPGGGECLLVLIGKLCCDPVQRGRITDVCECLGDNVIFKIFGTLVFLLAGMLFLFGRTGIIVIDIPVLALSGFTDERGTAVTAEGLAGQEIGIITGSGRGGMRHGILAGLNSEEGFVVDQTGIHVRELFAAVFIAADILGIAQGMLQGTVCEHKTEAGFQTAVIQIFDNIPHPDTGGILPEDVLHNGCLYGVQNDVSVSVEGITVWKYTPGVGSAAAGHTETAFDVLAEVAAVVFRHALQKAGNDDAGGVVLGGGRFVDGFHGDAVFGELIFIDCEVIAVPGEAVELPDDHGPELSAGGIGDHALEILPVLGLGAAAGAVDVLTDDLIAFPVGIGNTVFDLSLNGAF